MLHLFFLGKAVRDLQRLDRADRRLIKTRLLILTRHPASLQSQIKRIAGSEEKLFKLKVGSHRVIFKTNRKRLAIVVIRVGRGQDVRRDAD
jgi:mRNA-degrading endonuclease RelE of RelBE toxin-antitoxin system